LVELGVNDCEIARRLEIGRSTVRDIRTGRYQRRRPVATCPRCWRGMEPMAFTDELYAYLLGLYLGDGCIQLQPSGRTYSLRVSLDAKYPGIVGEARAALATSLPLNRASQHSAGPAKTVSVLCVYGSHLPCVFPQHGLGKKHERPIVLEAWQREVVERAPWPLIRGLIQSDGCRFDNRTGKYTYPSYEFCQVSHDIRGIFTDACDRVGTRYRDYGRRVRIHRRESVALLEQHVGAKS
jgi:hypothetical protein